MENSLLYLFGFSPFQGIQLNNLIEIIKIQINKDNKITVVLIHDGVIGTSKKGKTPEILKQLLDLPIRFKALIPDLKARGIDIASVKGNIQCIEYEDLVDLITNSTNIISWL